MTPSSNESKHVLCGQLRVPKAEKSIFVADGMRCKVRTRRMARQALVPLRGRHIPPPSPRAAEDRTF